jgi:outer membrane murein-binding lipoprotein Lpp
MDSRTKFVLRLAGCFVAVLLAGAISTPAQSINSTGNPGSATDLNVKIDKLTQSLEQTRTELDESRTEIRELRSMLEQVLQKENAHEASASTPSAPPESGAPAGAPVASGAPSAGPSALTSASPAQISQEDWQILNTRVNELQQDKVESASKYRVKLSGMVLATAFADVGQVDNLDVPTVADPRAPGESGGSAGGSLRQSIIGLTAVGPHLMGASTAADLQMDFFGGLPSGYGGVSTGIARLRIARVGLAWDNTSVIAGLDTPFFSPNAPSTYLSVAVPAFAAAGNLWTWTPGIRVEHRFDTSTSIFKVEGGLMDAPSYGYSTMTTRIPTPGESSRQPTYAVRFSMNGHDLHHPYALGVSGIYFPQLYANGYNIRGWGAVGDYNLPLGSRFELSGEMFLGKGLDVFGGVPQITLQAQDPYYSGVTGPALANLSMFGGWSQLKFRIDDRSEINAAVGSGGRVAAGVRQIVSMDPNVTNLSPRNDMFMFNYIFHVRSDVLLAPEFRRYRTYQVTGPAAYADQVGIAVGYLF